MRQIKLRAWNSAEQSMHEDVGIDPRAKDYFVFDKDGAVIDMYGSAPTLMLWTGLKDKHGKEIYEHDILVHRYAAGKTLYEAVIGIQTHYIDGLNYPYYGAHFLDLSRLNEPTSGLYYPDVKEMEVVGNRYQHPELIASEE